MKKALMNRVRRFQTSAADMTLFDRALLGTYQRYLRFRDRFRGSNSDHVSKLYLRSRNLRRNLNGKHIKFVNIDEASLWTLEWIQTFPQRYDLIVGVPRSGVFVASLIALKLGRPLTTPDLFQQGRYWQSQEVKDRSLLGQTSRILLVDDSMDSGRSMAKAEDVIRGVDPEADISRACLIITEQAKSSVDLYHKVVAPPRTFEWNILHRKVASHLPNGCLAVDLDGPLCANFPRGTDIEDVASLENARPYLIPAFEIDAIITCRLEKYRLQTETWLRSHGVRYKELLMRDPQSKSDQQAPFVRHKIDNLLRIKPDIFWESNWEQSQSIWQETRIPTLCIDRMELLN